jgi:RimJ/RimL family protein N-acetyltransferase
MVVIDDPFHGKAFAVQISQGNLDAPFVEGWDHCIARVNKQGLMGGFLFDRYRRRSICIHAAKFHPRWLNRHLLVASFGYVFLQLGVEKVFAQIDGTRPETIRFATGLGFKPEAILRDAVPGGDLVVLSMYLDGCRWLTLHQSCGVERTR